MIGIKGSCRGNYIKVWELSLISSIVDKKNQFLSLRYISHIVAVIVLTKFYELKLNEDLRGNILWMNFGIVPCSFLSSWMSSRIIEILSQFLVGYTIKKLIVLLVFILPQIKKNDKECHFESSQSWTAERN